MHKRLERDLMSLAHSILKMKNKDDVFALKEKSKEIYEKLSLLAFVEEYINTTSNVHETKEKLISKVEKALELKVSESKEEVIVDKVEKVVHQLEDVKVEVKEEVKVEEVKTELKVEKIIEEHNDKLKELKLSRNKKIDTSNKSIKKPLNKKAVTLEEELKDTISVDEMVTLFDVPVSKSLNDRLAKSIQIGLNDRIIFVKNLFNGSQEDFNRVVSQLNTYTSEKDAKKFLNKMVKPDYNWSEQEELEARFLEIIERKFA